MSLFEEEYRRYGELYISPEHALTPCQVKRVKAAAARNVKLQDLQIMVLDKYIVSLTMTAYFRSSRF